MNGVVVICVQGRPYACGLAQRRGGCGCYCANQNMWPSGACGPSLCGSVSVASAHLECRVGEVRRHLAGHAARLVAACARCRGVFLVGLASETHCQRCLWSLRSPGEEIRSAAKGRRSDEGAGQGRWSWALGHRHLFVDHLGVGLTFCVKLLFVGSRSLAADWRGLLQRRAGENRCTIGIRARP